MPFERPIFTAGLDRPPVRRYTGPILDVHTHIDKLENASLLAQVAADFGVERFSGIVRLELIEPLQHALGDRFMPVVWIDHAHVAEPERFVRENVRIVREARRLGAVAAKFWYAPRFYAESGLRFGHAALAPIFEALAELGMVALVHVADPNCWFETKYADENVYGTKAQQYEGLEQTLAAFPTLRIQGAHMGGDAEDLGHLRRLLDTYPNYYLDTSATKWVARELSVKPAESRAFVIERADRILFGSDLVVFAEATPADYGSRYWVQRWLWEGDGPRASPIPDACSPWPGGPQVYGLNLPDDVLRKIYTDNARRVLGIV
jgi:predicted TIM-barrel fold metal-dependent hydrolase